MKRILLTGMSGTGKSTVIGERAARGYKAVDAASAGSHVGSWMRRTSIGNTKASLADRPSVKWNNYAKRPLAASNGPLGRAVKHMATPMIQADRW